MQKPVVLWLLFLGWFFCPAQPSNSSFLHYTTAQGLSNDHITDIAKDKLGFMWVATVNGLNRFDGHSFKIFRHDPNDQNSIPGDDITGVTLGSDSWLWITTIHGVCKLDPVRLTIIQIHLPENDDTLDNDHVTKVAFDSKGMAWTTGIHGIYKINPSDNHPESFIKTTLPTLAWYGMLIDRQDRIWMLKDSVRRFDPVTGRFSSFTGVNPKESLYHSGVLSLEQDASGQIWAGTWGYGIWKYDAQYDDFVHQPGSQTLAMMLLPDALASGRQFFWVGGGKSGLGIYYPDTKQFIEFKPDPQDPFTHNNYLAKNFFKDNSSGDVWIGTEVGLEHYAPATIRFGRAMIPVEKDMGQFSLVSGVVNDISDLSGQRYFISVWGTGLFAWNKTTGEFTRMKFSLSEFGGGDIFNLFQDSRSEVWGCLKGGISRYNPQTNQWRGYEHFFHYNDRNNLFWCGLEDSKGNVWFGSNKEGLFKYNRDKDRMEQAFSIDSFLDEKGVLNILSISEDTSDRLWLACNASSLIRFDPATGETIQFPYRGLNAPLQCNVVEAASNGKVYAGFYTDFLELDQNGNILRKFNEQNGLKTNRIYYMVEDHQGKIWITSVYLLHCFDPVTGTFTYFGKSDGLFSNTMTDGLSITHSGEIFVGFQNAFNFFYPDRLRRNQLPPPIAITSIKVMNEERQVSARNSRSFLFGLFKEKNKTIGNDTVLILRPGEDFFEVEFAALNFNQQERNRYAYRLEGFNKDWIYTDRPIATFTNLDGGNYILHMKAANNDGVWNEQGTTLDIQVIPPFNRTRWFPVLIAFVLSCMLFGLLWYRRHQRQRIEKFREALARDLHDEMGSTLSSIRFFSEYADQQIGDDKPKVKPMLQRISQSATTLSESMQDIIWAMKIKNEEFEDLTTHMTEFGLGLLESRKVQFKTTFSGDISGKHLQPEVRRNIYLIFKEAVTNAAKYAEATLVELQLSVKKGWLIMNISDNGKGFEAGNTRVAGSGNGLQNMRRRAVDMGGKVEIFTTPGEGTRVELRVKI